MFIGIFFTLFYSFKSSHNPKVRGSNPLPATKIILLFKYFEAARQSFGSLNNFCRIIRGTIVSNPLRGISPTRGRLIQEDVR
jgi:hypothetical protein